MADTKRTKQPSESEIPRAFEECADDAGMITKEEVSTIFQKLGLSVSEEELNQLFNNADTDQDGRITYDEFRPMVPARS